jgi:hypothetical protein
MKKEIMTLLIAGMAGICMSPGFGDELKNTTTSFETECEVESFSCRLSQIVPAGGQLWWNTTDHGGCSCNGGTECSVKHCYGDAQARYTLTPAQGGEWFHNSVLGNCEVGAMTMTYPLTTSHCGVQDFVDLWLSTPPNCTGPITTLTWRLLCSKAEDCAALSCSGGGE